MKLFVYQNEELEEIKCYGCGWRVSKVFFLAENDEEAAKITEKLNAQYLKGEESFASALCGECMSELLAEENYKIEKKE